MVDQTPFRNVAEDFALAGRVLTGRPLIFDTFNRDDGLFAGDVSVATSGAVWNVGNIDTDTSAEVFLEDGAVRWHGSNDDGDTYIWNRDAYNTFNTTYDEIAVEVVWQPGTTGDSGLILAASKGSNLGASAFAVGNRGVYLEVIAGVPDEPNDPADVETSSVSVYVVDNDDPLPDPIWTQTAVRLVADGKTHHRYSMVRIGAESLAIFTPDGGGTILNVETNQIDDCWGHTALIGFHQPVDTYPTDRVAIVTGFATGPSSNEDWVPDAVAPTNTGAAVDDVAGVFTYSPNTFDHEEAQVLVDSTSTALPDGDFYGQQYTLSAVATGTNKTFVWPANTVFTSVAPILGKVIGDRMSVTFRWNETDWIEVSRAGGDSRLEGHAIADAAGVFTYLPNSYISETAALLVDSTSNTLPDGTYFGQEYTLSVVATGTAKTYVWPTNTVFTSAAPVAGLVIGDRMSVTFRWNTVDWVEVSRASSTKPRLKALTDGANIATNALLGDTFTVTLGGDRTMDNPTNPRAGQEITYAIRQDGTAPRLITWGAAFRFSGGTAPTLTNANNKTDYVSFLYNGTDSKWDCVSTALNF